MRKLFLAAFVALALLLPSQSLRAGDQNWKQLEAEFRRDLVYRDFYPSVGLTRPKQEAKSYRFPWKPAQWSRMLSQVHLMRARRRFDPGRISYKIAFSSGDYVHDTQAIRLDAGRDCGWIELESPSPKQSVKWNRYELTPASCRFLKRQIWAKFGPEFRALAKLRHLNLAEPK